MGEIKIKKKKIILINYYFDEIIKTKNKVKPNVIIKLIYKIYTKSEHIQGNIIRNNVC